MLINEFVHPSNEEKFIELLRPQVIIRRPDNDYRILDAIAETLGKLNKHGMLNLN